MLKQRNSSGDQPLYVMCRSGSRSSKACQRLIENGVKGYSYRAFINAYKTNLVVIFVMFSMSVESVDRSSERAQELFHKFYSRLDSALVDWEIEKLLKVLPLMVPFIKLSSWLKSLFR